MVINEETGETVLGDSRVHLLFTVESWLWVEKRLGLTVLEILERAIQMRFGMEHTVVLVWAGAEAWRRRFAIGEPAFTEARAVKAVEEAGGFLPAMRDVASAIRYSTALGTGLAGESEAPAEDPFSSGTSSANAPSSAA